MTIIKCDKCGKDLTQSPDKRHIIGMPGYLFTKDSDGIEVAVSSLELCVSCKEKIGLIIKNWLEAEQE